MSGSMAPSSAGPESKAPRRQHENRAGLNPRGGKSRDGQWNIPALRFLLENIAPHHTVMEAYEVEREFPRIGRRSLLLNAREVVSQRNARKLILLTIEDVTERRAAERATTELLRQKEMLLHEMQHRIANSLQIIASILLLNARTARRRRPRCSWLPGSLTIVLLSRRAHRRDRRTMTHKLGPSGSPETAA